METKNKIFVTWKAPYFLPSHRGKMWYIIFSFFIASLISYGIISHNWIMSIALVIILALFLFIEKKELEIIKTSINGLGIQNGEKFYSYGSIKDFWIVYHPPYIQVLYLNIHYRKSYKRIRIELGKQDPQKIRKILKEEIKELEGGAEPIFDIFIRLLKLK